MTTQAPTFEDLCRVEFWQNTKAIGVAFDRYWRTASLRSRPPRDIIADIVAHTPPPIIDAMLAAVAAERARRAAAAEEDRLLQCAPTDVDCFAHIPDGIAYFTGTAWTQACDCLCACECDSG